MTIFLEHGLKVFSVNCLEGQESTTESEGISEEELEGVKQSTLSIY